MHYKQVANRRKEKWQTGGRDKCLSAAEPSEVLKVWLIRIPSFCVDDSNSVPNLPLPMKNIGKKAPGSFIHKLYGLRSPDPLHKRVGEPDYSMCDLFPCLVPWSYTTNDHILVLKIDYLSHHSMRIQRIWEDQMSLRGPKGFGLFLKT